MSRKRQNIIKKNFRNTHIMKYVIEQIDPEMFEWCIVEYLNAASAVGKENFMVTNVGEQDVSGLSGIETKKEKVGEMGLKRVCVLDPEAEEELVPEDAEKYDYLVFGGILGHYPPQSRTRNLVVESADRRNLGKDQMTTDNAVMTAKQIMTGKKISELEFVQDFVIDIEKNEDTGAGEQILLPFKYVIIDGKPFISDEIIEYVKEHGF